MTSHDTDTVATGPSPRPGRGIELEPLAPGAWTLIVGVCIAVLAPLFGFLIGTTFGPGDGEAVLTPIYLGLFLGVVVGGLGVLVALWGGWRIFHRRRDDRIEQWEAAGDLDSPGT